MALFVPNPQSDGDTLQELITTAHEGRYPHWIWLPNTQMPDLPAEPDFAYAHHANVSN